MVNTLHLVLGALSGVLVGFSLGLVGGGGSILAVPLMVYVVGVHSPHVAIGTSALAVAVNAATGMKFFNVSEAEAQEVAAIEEVRETLRGKTSYVVVGEEPGTKRDDAERLGIAMISAEDLVRMAESGAP